MKTFKGMDIIIINPKLLPNAKFETKRVRTHKKKRIDKKYFKKYGTYEYEVVSGFLIVNDKIHMSQKTYDKLKDIVEVYYEQKNK